MEQIRHCKESIADCQFCGQYVFGSYIAKRFGQIGYWDMSLY